MIKHIFSDMDGTLLQSNGKISENNVQVIKQSKIPFTLVSARSPMEMDDVIDKLELDEPQIAFNGGLIFQKKDTKVKVLKSDTIDLKSVERVINCIKEEFTHTSYSLYDLDNWYVEKMDQGNKYEHDIGGQEPRLIDFDSLLKQTDLKIYKIMLITFDLKEMETMISRLKEFDDGSININQSSENYLEITSNLAEKSRGIEYIKELENLNKSDMAAFGDGYNDLSMLESVGIPIVMENALDGVKSYGKHLTKDNDNDGVAHGIVKYLLEK